VTKNISRRALFLGAMSTTWLGLMSGIQTAQAEPTSEELQSQLEEARQRLESVGKHALLASGRAHGCSG
jgi:hypothetical protein